MAQGSRLTAVAQAGERVVVAGPRGAILFSDDRGRSWQVARVPVSSDLVALRFIGAHKGWAVGHDGVILHSADGGATWSKQLDGVEAAALIGEFYGRAESSRKLPVDAGLVEEAKRFAREGADKPFLDIAFISDTEGVAVGAFNLSMRTTDGGKTWTPLIDRTANPKGLHLYSLAVSGKDLYLSGEQGLLRRWNRDASRFEELKSPYGGSFFGLLIKGNSLFAFGLQGNAFRSRDGGTTWVPLRGFGLGSINAAALLADGRIVFATQGGKLYQTRDDGDTVSELPDARPMPYFGVAPAASDGRIVVVGPRGVELKAVP